MPSILDVYQVGFAEYTSPGGAMKMREIVGEQALKDFFTSIGVQPNIAESAFRGLRTEGSASILSVVLPEEMLRMLGLQDDKRFLSGKEKVEAAIQMLKRQGHSVQAVVVGDKGTFWFDIDNRMRVSWVEMQNLAEGVYSLAGLEEEFKRRQTREQQAFSVWFTVFREPAGPVLAYCVAQPFASRTFASKSGARFQSMEHLVETLNRVGLPGEEIAGFTDKAYPVTGAQLHELGLKLPQASGE
ncbi:MAG: hypothetical protein WB249_05455 [Candidatus Sulfotelmatobacter sp.]